MIYRCSSKDCGYWCEGEMLEGAACPWCGKELLRAEEKNMSGDDWAALGGFWSEQGAKGKYGAGRWRGAEPGAGVLAVQPGDGNG